MDRSSSGSDERRPACSPHTRGWTGDSELVVAFASGVPRTRGDGPGSHRRPHGPQRVFPAHAGMDRQAARRTRWKESVPRTRGDGPLHASMSSQYPCRVPRTRGDGPPCARSRQTTTRSVPRTRGDGPFDGKDLFSASRVFPAHAGMDRKSGAPVFGSGSVPRTRGDGPAWLGDTGSSHHVFPAHAGMDQTCWRKAIKKAKCSPHTRGWTVPVRGHITGISVFPAHAGMDRPR